jgi:hypothetical protein
MWINVQRHVPRTTSSHLDTIELDELSARAGGKLATPSLPQSVGVQHHPEQFGQRWRRVHRLPDELGRDPAEFANGPGIEEVTVAERSSSPGRAESGPDGATAAEAAVFVDRCCAVGLPTAGVMAEVPAARCAPTRSLAPSTSSAPAPTT